MNEIKTVHLEQKPTLREFLVPSQAVQVTAASVFPVVHITKEKFSNALLWNQKDSYQSVHLQ